MKQDSKRYTFLVGIIIPAILLLGWQFYAVKANHPAIAPTIPAVLKVLQHPFRNLLQTSSYSYHILVSTTRVLIGFALATLVAVPLGILMGRKKWAYNLLNPTISFLRPLSPIVWVPFTLVIFKTYSVAEMFGKKYNAGLWGEIQIGMLFVIFYGGFFPIFSNTLYSVQSVKKLYIESAKMLGVSRLNLYTRVILPHATPGILTGLKIGLGRTWMVIVAAEMLPGSSIGIGYLITFAYEMCEMEILIAGMILTGIVGASLSGILNLVSYKVSFWKDK